MVLKVEQVPVPSGNKHPDSPFEQLPKHEYH